MKNINKCLLVLIAVTAINAHSRVRQIRCESMSDRYTECSAGGRVQNISLERQLSHASCQEGRSFGVANVNDRIYVDRGCRGVFNVDVSEGWGGGGGFDDFDVKCESWGGAYNECEPGVTIRRVVLKRQVSGSPCIEGQTWIYDRRLIKVKNGCRAVFRVTPR